MRDSFMHCRPCWPIMTLPQACVPTVIWVFHPRLGAVLKIMTFFVAFIANDSKDVFLSTFRPCSIGVCCIGSSSGDTRIGVFPLAFLFLPPLFFLLPSLFGGFALQWIVQRFGLLSLGLRFFDPRVCTLAAVTWAGWLPRWHRWSISRMKKWAGTPPWPLHQTPFWSSPLSYQVLSLFALSGSLWRV